MTDKELLELAAKAAGIEINWSSPFVSIGDFVQVPDWNPLTDDGDALRLAVKLHLDICIRPKFTFIGFANVEPEEHNGDRYKSTRRAIVRAAAEIGKTL